VAIALAVAVAHGGVLGAGFVAFDDDHYVYRNSMVAQGLSGESVAWAFSLHRERTYFHPLTWLSLALDGELFGLDPRGFHLVNLLLHALSAVLLFRFLARATGRTAGPLLAALLFAAHPVTVEAVAWVSERKAALSTALAMASIVAWGAYARRPSAARYALVAAAFLLAMLAKPGVVALPLVLLALDAWPLRRAPWPWTPGAAPAWRRLAVEKVPLLAAGLAIVALAIASFETSGAGTPSTSLRVENALASLGTYLRVALWPSGLAVHHPFPAAAPAGAAALGAALLCAGTLAAVRLAGRAPFVLAGWCWFVLALGPYLGLVQNGLWPGWAERFAYFALPGLAVAVGFGVTEWAGSRARAGALALALLVPLAVRTRAQVGVWRDSVTLFSRAVEVEPDSCVARYDLGRSLLVAGRHADAARELRATIDRCPPAAAPHAALGMALYAQERLEEAEAELREALRLAPDDPPSLNYLALVLWRTGRRAEAEPVLETFVRVAPPDLLERFLRLAPDDMTAAREAARTGLAAGR
jgi:hypothetical protein